ncbi:HRDC domain-containing protein [Pedobacter sp. Du54]|uniref:HRDC domain-containing protein n=1 Tax=Pedobacter anseongensis TaxID=3133439 RepID=UPI0030A54C2E
MKLDSLHHLIIDCIEKTNKPIFLTGKAGTGKTTFLHYIRSTTKKNLAVVAPTAVAAINAGGLTIHSFFQVPFGPILPVSPTHAFIEFSGKSFGTEKAKLIKCLDLLIIDEISMVRADVIDYIDRVLRFVKGSSRPFGGVQLLMIGDLYQLPPVFQNDWHLLAKFYKGPYFFDSLIFREYPLLTFELTTVHRQSDPIFIELLNEIRNGAISEPLLSKLNEQYKNAQDLADYVTLTTHNPLVKKINEERLAQLGGESHTFKAKVTDDFPKEAYPTDEELILKVGAMVMFIKNDSSGKQQFYNGRTAKVVSISGNSIKVTFNDDGTAFEALLETWDNTKYTLSETDQKIIQTSAGSFTQFPLRLAWAITIHKSQGLTFDKAVIDVGAAFAHGQTYVALSRCRNLEGMILKEKVDVKNIITDPSVTNFMKKAQQQVPSQKTIAHSLANKEIESLIECFEFTSIRAAWAHLQVIIIQLFPNEKLIIEIVAATQDLLNIKIDAIAQQFIRKELKPINETTLLKSMNNRLGKASGYFVPQLITLKENILNLHQLCINSPFEPDYFPTLNFLLEQVEAKIAVFNRLPTLENTNQIQAILKNIATSYKQVDSWKVKPIKEEMVIENPILYAKLIKWRQQTAENKKVLSYHILSDMAIADISARLPRSLSQLAKIKNIGDGKTMQHGDEILKLIRAYLGEGDLFG